MGGISGVRRDLILRNREPMGGPGSGNGGKNAGRKRNDNGFHGRAWCRDLASNPEALAAVEARAKTDPEFWLRIFEHGFGRPGQAIDVTVAGKGREILHRVTIDGRGSAESTEASRDALPPGATGVPAADVAIGSAD